MNSFYLKVVRSFVDGLENRDFNLSLAEISSQNFLGDIVEPIGLVYDGLWNVLRITASFI